MPPEHPAVKKCESVLVNFLKSPGSYTALEKEIFLIDNK
jgi:hypothetical protein